MHDFYGLQQQVPLKGEYDVIVVGGGTAGSAAATAAAGMGASTLLLEKFSFMGGLAAGGQVTPMMPVKIAGNPDSSPFNRRLKERLRSEGYGDCDAAGNDGWFNPEMIKFVLEEMYTEAGGKLLYESEFISPLLGGEKIEGVVVKNKAGLEAYRAARVIDCTGDAEVAAASATPCLPSPPVTQQQAVSLRFMLGGVNLERLQNYLGRAEQKSVFEHPRLELAMVSGRGYMLEEVFRQGLEQGLLQEEDLNYFQAFSVPGMTGVLALNCPEVNDVDDPLSPVQRTGALLKLRQKIRRLYRFLRKMVPGFENSYIAAIAVMPGVRETRRIEGVYVLKLADYRQGKRFQDGIARSAYPIDVHGQKLEVNEANDGFLEVPLRALIPVKPDNLLVAGRSLSAEFRVQSALRIQPVCRATGEAAGLAAVYSLTHDINVRDVNGVWIREMMKKRGAFL